MKVVIVVGVVLCALGTQSVIIPDELPSILSVIYSNIPTIKKGTDSRLGWGFRLGERADFQVLVELGPQTNTQPLANQGDSSSSSSKRNTLDSLANTLYAQRQQEKKEREILKKQKVQEKKPSKPTTEVGQGSAEWLKTWSQSVSKHQENEAVPPKLGLEAKPGLAVGEIDAKSVIPDEEEDKPTTTSPKEDALDNVDLE